MKRNSITKDEKNTEKVSDNDAGSLLLSLMPYHPGSSRFTVVCKSRDYSAARIAHAIEDVGAHVLNLNITDRNVGDDMMAVDVRVDWGDISSIIRSLARYEYAVEDAEVGIETLSETERKRIEEFLRYIDV